MTTPTAQEVADRAIRDLGADYTQHNFIDDDAFQEYVLGVSTDVVADQTPRVTPYTLDNPRLYEAAALETMSRLVQRVLNLYYGNVLATESITLGPITLQQGRNESVSADIRKYAEQLHLEAEAKLHAAGGASRKGAIRVWTPANRIVIV